MTTKRKPARKATAKVASKRNDPTVTGFAGEFGFAAWVHTRLNNAQSLLDLPKRLDAEWTPAEAINVIDRLFVLRAGTQTLLRSRDATIAALEADLADAHARIATQQAAATAATVDIDAMVRDVLTQDHKRNAYGPPPVLVLQQRGDEMHASLCVALGGTVLPYRSAWNFGHTIAEAVIALVHGIDPSHDVTGMCAGLRALHGAAS
jgi:hypothetical protein